MNETIDDIVREIRDKLNAYGVKCFGEIMYSRGDLADRIEKAYKDMVEGLNDGIVERDQYIAELTDNNSKIIAERNELDELNRKCCDKNERLLAALKPVLDVSTAEIDSSLEVARMASFANGIHRMCHAVRKAQKIWKEGQEK